MIYYKDENLIIRDMIFSDSEQIYREELNQGWKSDIKIYKEYFLAQEKKQKFIFIAEFKGEIAGYTTLVLNGSDGPFINRGIPEIVNLVVFIRFQKRGIGNKILDTVENKAVELGDKVYLGVGCHSGYGAAQRIYVKRGYIFDGSGVWYKGKQLKQYANCCNDDELVLYLVKNLNRMK